MQARGNPLRSAAAVAAVMLFGAPCATALAQVLRASGQPEQPFFISSAGGVSTIQTVSGAVLRSTAATVDELRLVQVPGADALVVTWTEHPGGAAAKEAWYAAALDGRVYSEPRRHDRRILLKQAQFDPAQGEPVDGLRAVGQADQGHLRIVQFITPPLEPYRHALAAAAGPGSDLSAAAYLPNSALIVRLDDAGAQAVAQLPFVRWVGPYSPAYKCDPDLLKPDTVTVTIQVFERGLGQKSVVATRVAALGGIVVPIVPEGYLVQATLPRAALQEALRLDEVLWADAYGPGGVDMDVARQVTGADFVLTTLGFNGQGVRGEVMDDNILSTHVDFQSPAPLFHGSRSGATDHGTCCYGILFGKGVGNTLATGMLPGAEQGIFADKDPILTSYATRYTHTAELVNPAGPYRAVFQSNSWGSDWSTTYTSISATVDDILFQNNIVLTQSMSNNANQLARPEAWAKNIIACGGIQHNDTATRTDDIWWQWSSVGPAADGRIKPDLSHLADEILTTFDTNNSAYIGGFNGTSSATAITAGTVGIMMQMWKEQVFPGFGNSSSTVFAVRPKAATARALLINTAYQYAFSGTGHSLTRTHQGWGTADLQNLYNLRNQMLIVDGTEILAPLATKRYTVNVPAGGTLRATLVFTDPAGNPASSVARINDLSLKLTSPSNVVYWGNNGLLAGNWSTPGGSRNTIDPIENVFIQSAEGGNWFVDVSADEIAVDGYPTTPAVDSIFSLVVSGISSCSTPAFTTNPSSLTRCAGTSATFTVAATGSPAPTLQWRKGGVNIPGATSTSYTIASPTEADAGTYDCVATNTCGPTASSAATLIVNTAPAITTQPAATSGCTGGPASFTIAVTGTPAPTFQWRKNGTNISGATSATYTLSSLVAGDAANYSCVVTNSCGSVTSSNAALTVNTAPSITTQPTGLTRCPGVSATFTVAAGGTPSPTFQWRKDGANIGGATSASYTIASPGAADAGAYDCVVTNVCATATSSSATLTMNTLPLITTQPTSLSRCPGVSATFSVVATGTPSPTFQWRKNGTNIGGATSASYTIASPVAGSAGTYDCIVTNSCGSVTSNGAVLTINTAAAITTQPTNQTACTGGSASFTVAASGTPAPTFQWRKNSVNIGGATSATLSLTGIVAGDAASYDCVVTNSCNAVTSSAATLTVNTAPVISTQPADQATCTGASASFAVVASGSPAPTFQWRKNSVNISGATSATYTIASVVASDAASYDCVVTNSCGSAATATAALTVNTSPSVTTQPTNQAACAGGSASFTVAASGSPAPSFQWRKNGTNIGGATAATLSLTGVVAADAANYDCVITNTCGTATSSAATLTVNTAAAITTQPVGLTRCPGESAAFTVAASGSPAPTYQWRKNGTNIGGATSASYAIAAPSASDAGSYDCVVTNACTTVTSSAATLTMNTAPLVTTQPSPQAACTGGSASFTVAASGAPAPAFQWRKNSVNIPGATSASYSLASVVAGDAASYDCVISNTCGSATSSAVALTVNTAPSVTTQPTPQAACTGGSASFSVAATGDPAPTFQWRKNSVTIGGATAATLSLTGIVAGDAANYDCVITNTCGSATSSAVALTVNTAPSVTTQPSPQAACTGGSASFTVAASGAPAPTFQWRKNSVNISGATNATLSLTAIVAGDAANYDCVITNTCGTATSNSVALTVNTPPAITTQPASLTRCTGVSATFTVAAIGSPSPTFQWRKDGSNIAGATSASHTIASPASTDAATYDCIVTNSCSSVTSAGATLTVSTGAAITTQPTPQAACPGGAASFTVAASGSPAPSYQWRKNGTSIGGATSSTLSLTAIVAGDAASYDCVVTNTCGSATSTAAALTVNAGPAITTQPTPQAACPGGSASFTVAASGAPAPTYQWRKNGTNIGGATGATLSLTGIVAGDAANYDCILTNTCGSAASSAAALTVNAPASVTTQPTSLTRCAGASASFTVAAAGTPAPSFQWRKDTVNIPGATTATYTIASPAVGDAGSYDCVVTNACGSSTSTAATLTINTSASITAQPGNQAACPGGSASFTVAASGAPVPTFQWRKNSVNITGATSATYSLASVVAGDAASYDCVVTNACGSATSIAATLTVNAGPVITTQPAPQAACLGGSASFAVAASGSPAPAFQWRKNGFNIPGATSATLALTGISAGDAADYDCVSTNSCGSTTSSAAALTVNAAPAIITQPTPATVCSGSSASFTVAATGTPTPTFQWRKNSVNIAGATSATYTINPAAAADTASYDCIVTNTCGSANSTAATLTVNAGPAFTTQPSPQAACSGGSAAFTVAVSGSPAPTLQWRKGGVDIPGATSATLTINPVAPADAASYDCVAFNTCGPVTSTAAALTVNLAPAITTQPTPQSPCAGGAASFTVAASGSPAPSLQWRKDSTNIPGATAATLSFSSVTAADAASYDCVITNTCGSVTSSAVALTVNAAPIIITDPSDQTACSGLGATFAAAASGSPAPAFQWRKGGTPIAGATGSSYVISAVTPADAGSYDCVVTNACGSATTLAATLTINVPPSISTQPTEQTVCSGSPASFIIAVSGTPAPTLQWRNGGVNIPGATSPTLTIPAAGPSDAATYDCLVTNACGSVASSGATLTVNTAPTISTQPSDQAACAGSPASFTVAASGSPAPTYQWRKNSTPISGATAATFAIPAVAPGDAASYDCVITNSCGSVTSSPGALSLLAGPGIITQPTNQSACTGGSAAFLVTASGSGTLSYQWQRNGVNIPGATSATLTISPVSAGDVAAYAVVVTNTCGSVTSTAGVLSLADAPSITTQPEDTTVNAGATALFTVSASGSPPLTFQWRKNGVNLTNGGSVFGAATATLTINPARLVDQGGYDVVVSSGCGPTTSAAAALVVICRADWNGDNTITPADVAEFVSAWSASLAQGNLAADFDNDGHVAPADVAAFVSEWFAALSGAC